MNYTEPHIGSSALITIDTQNDFTSIYEASERDFRLVLVEDAVSGLYEKGVEEMRRIGVAVMTTGSFLALS
jgi:nicotinamidase-related amidase